MHKEYSDIYSVVVKQLNKVMTHRGCCIILWSSYARSLHGFLTIRFYLSTIGTSTIIHISITRFYKVVTEQNLKSVMWPSVVLRLENSTTTEVLGSNPDSTKFSFCSSTTILVQHLSASVY